MVSTLHSDFAIEYQLFLTFLRVALDGSCLIFPPVQANMALQLFLITTCLTNLSLGFPSALSVDVLRSVPLFVSRGHFPHTVLVLLPRSAG